MTKKNKDLEQIKELIVNPKIGEILIQHKKISIEQLELGLKAQKNNNIPIGRILIDKGFICENDLVELLSIQKNVVKLLEDSYNELEKLKNERSESL